MKHSSLNIVQSMRKLKLQELNRLSPEEYSTAKKLSIAVVLDNVRSLNNVGSAFRTSDALNVEKLYLCGITGTPPHRDIQKTAIGAQDVVEWKHFDDTQDAISALKKEGYTIASVEQTENSTSLQDIEVNQETKIALVFGNEVKGVNQEVINASDLCIEIPQFGTKHSFNISVSMGIVLWEIVRKMKF